MTQPQPLSLAEALARAAGMPKATPPVAELTHRGRRIRRNAFILRLASVAAAGVCAAAVLQGGSAGGRPVRTVGPSEHELSPLPSVVAPSGSPAATPPGPTPAGRSGGQSPAGGHASPNPGSGDPGASTAPERRIAFRHGYRLETMRPDGTDRHVVGDGWLRPAGWSSGGDRLAVVFPGTQSQGALGVVDVHRGTVTAVVDRAGLVVDSAAWSPDGRWIAYSSKSSDWNDLRLVRPDGRDDHAIPVHGCRPAWAPDSKRLAAVSCGGSGAELDMMTAESDGTGRRVLTGLRMSGVSWSPDGGWIVGATIADQLSADPPGLAVFHPDGSGLRKLPSGSTADPPAWADGRRVVYASQRLTSTSGQLCSSAGSAQCDRRAFGLYSIDVDSGAEAELTSDGEGWPVMPMG